MSSLETIPVAAGEAGLRLDRWFKRRYPGLSHSRLERLLRTGQVRLDGKRAKAGARLAAGQRVRVPPLDDESLALAPPRLHIADAAADHLRSRVLYRDDEVIVIDKPAGLAVQGGSKTVRHLDAMLDALCFGARERPRLVHRLDKHTSGVLVLARGAASAAWLAAAFRSRSVHKLYWALVAGVPRPARGVVELALAKQPGRAGERVVVEAAGREAATSYAVIEAAGRRAAWLALAPRSGRTHQLRVHCRALGTPVLGDGKYGGTAAFVRGADLGRGLHLHARAIRLALPGGGEIEATAPLPAHMRQSFRFFGFDLDTDGDPLGVMEPTAHRCTRVGKSRKHMAARLPPA